MMQMTRKLLVVIACSFLLVSVGCNSGDKSKPKAEKAKTPPAVESSAPTSEDHSKGPALSDEDKALVAAQRLCPVTDEDLMADAEMGGPVKLTVKGETVFICCSGCEKKLRADEDGMLAKVAELKKGKPEGQPDESK